MTVDPRVETVLRILDELPIHAAQHDIDAAAVAIVAAIDGHSPQPGDTE